VIPHWLLEGRVLRALSRAIVIAATVTGLGVLACLGRLYWSAEQANRLDRAATGATSELKQVEADIAQAKAVRQSQIPESKRTLAAFQSAANAAASRHGLILNELMINQEVQPYLSKYTNDNPPAGWQQVAVRMTLAGRVQDMFAALEEMKGAEVPFEIDVIDVNRATVDRQTGAATVTTQVQLRVLMRA